MITYFSASDFYKNLFGQKVYKISLDAGCTCPTRDGTKGIGGCIFCSTSGSGDFASSKNLSIKEQVEQAKKLVENKLSSKNQTQEKKYIAYFQNFTNTYGNQEELLEKFTQAINQENIVGLAIGTRPDCLSNEMIKKISELRPRNYPPTTDYFATSGKKISELRPRNYPNNQEFHISIELGFQTSNENSAKFIRRGYENSVYTDCVNRIHKIAPEIHVVTHLIFGLPDETENDMLKSVEFVLNAQTDGIKFTILHVLENTDLANLWKEGKVQTLSQNEYFEILKKSLQLINSFENTNQIDKKIVIHRLTGDGAKKILLAPMWTANKKKVLNDLSSFLRKN